MNTLDQYRQAKADIARYETTAKKELINRFHELEAEMVRVKEELRREFGVKTIPKGKPQAKKAAVVPQPVPGSIESSRIRNLERKLETENKRLTEATSQGLHERAVQKVRDRIYEIEDELRLARGA